MQIDDIRKVEELEDGSSVYEFGNPVQEEVATEFHSNLAINFSEEGLKKISTDLINSIEEDILSRKEWLTAVEKVKKYLGFGIQDLENIPFKQATRTYDTTLATALIRFYATTRAELLPQDGPAGYKIDGDNTETLEAKGDEVTQLLNHYLTVIDDGYYPDFEKCILYLGLYGSAFKKVYYDPIQSKVMSRFIMPHDFIVNNDCNSILESDRLTHVLHLSKREILLKQQNNLYRDVELPYLKSSGNADVNDDENDDEINSSNSDDKIDLDAYSTRSLFEVYEVHTYLNLDDFKNTNIDKKSQEIPLPYVVTIDKTSKEVLSIRRNWKEEDTERKKDNYFIQYNYLPGFGIYGLGLAHLIGSNAITLTKILRQLVDAASFKNLPGGMRVKGFKSQNNDLIIGPGEFVEVDTGGVPLSEAFMPLPYSEPSQTLRELRLEIIDQTRELGSTSELGMLESKEDIPTGTTLAMLETNNRIQSAVLKSIHYSLTQELRLINKNITEVIAVEGDATEEELAARILIIPVSDPSMNSSIHKMLKAETAFEIAKQAPELHNMRELLIMQYKAINLDDAEIDKILKPAEEEAPDQQQSPAVDPSEMIMADINQKEQETLARERIANLKAETDVFKAQLDFEKEKAKIESNEDIAKLKSETDLIKKR